MRMTTSLLDIDETAVLSQPRISLLGTAGLLFDPGGALDLGLQRRIWALAQRAAQWPEIREAVPCLNNLMLAFALPAPRDIASLTARLEDTWEQGESLALDEDGRIFDLVVDYGGEFGSRMEHVCEHTGLTVDEVVARHSEPLYVVYGLGSHPGHAYLGGMDPTIATPRRKVPALDNPGGSVSIGGIQTSVSASSGPTGWNAIGKTDMAFFDVKANPPAVLRPGDRLRFCPRKVIR